MGAGHLHGGQAWVEGGVLGVAAAEDATILELQRHSGIALAVGGIALAGGGQRGLPQGVVALKHQLVVGLGAHQGIGDLEIGGAEGVGQEGLQLAQVIRQGDFQGLGGAQLVHELAAVTARGVVDGDFTDPGLAAEPGVGDGGLLGVHRVEQPLARKLHVGAKIPAAAQAAGDGADEEPGDGSDRAGGRQRQQGQAQGPIVEPGGGFQRRHLLRGKTGLEIVPQHGQQGGLERGGKGLERLGKAGMHTVSSKANWGAIVGSKRGEMCERAHALMGKGAGMVKETFVFRNLCACSQHQGSGCVLWL